VTYLTAPDRAGQFADVVLGYDNFEGYLKDSPYFGALIGRYGNRIAKGRFKLYGVEYRLAVNNAPSALHGGVRGFDKMVWKVANAAVTAQGPRLALTYFSRDGEEGYPGTQSSGLSVNRAESWTDLSQHDRLSFLSEMAAANGSMMFGV